jgi:hypothetical protein
MASILREEAEEKKRQKLETLMQLYQETERAANEHEALAIENKELAERMAEDVMKWKVKRGAELKLLETAYDEMDKSQASQVDAQECLEKTLACKKQRMDEAKKCETEAQQYQKLVEEKAKSAKKYREESQKWALIERDFRSQVHIAKVRATKAEQNASHRQEMVTICEKQIKISLRHTNEADKMVSFHHETAEKNRILSQRIKRDVDELGSILRCEPSI